MFLPERVSAVFASVDNILVPAAGRASILKEYAGRYSTVTGHRSEWVAYLHRKDVRELWDLQPSASAITTLSVAAALKSNGVDLRKIN